MLKFVEGREGGRYHSFRLCCPTKQLVSVSLLRKEYRGGIYTVEGSGSGGKRGVEVGMVYTVRNI